MKIRFTPVFSALFAVAFSACQDVGVAPDIDSPDLRKSSGGSNVGDAVLAAGNDINAALANDGSDIRLGLIEWFTEADEVGRSVFFNNVGNKRLAFQFAPGDPRRTWSGAGPGDDITWASDQTQGDAGPGLAATQAAIDRAMATWEEASCSNLPLTKIAPGGNLGIVEFIVSGSTAGSDEPAADVLQGGFGTIVDAVLPPPIIAATFTFIFAGFTDIDNDGYADAAFREVYYTNNFAWGINSNVDVETVALHENGHSLSQGHFGKLFRTDSNGKFHFAPRAVMNAGYTGVQQSLTGTDNGGHCGMWGSWPNR